MLNLSIKLILYLIWLDKWEWKLHIETEIDPECLFEAMAEAICGSFPIRARGQSWTWLHKAGY